MNSKVCLIIGVGSFGEHIIQKYQQEGYTVLVSCNSQSSQEHIRQIYGDSVVIYDCDLTSEESVRHLFQRAASEYSHWERIVFHARSSVKNEELDYNNFENALKVSCVSLLYILKNLDSWWPSTSTSTFIVTSGDYAQNLNPNRICVSLEKSTQYNIVRCYKDQVNFGIHEAVIQGAALVDMPRDVLLSIFI